MNKTTTLAGISCFTIAFGTAYAVFDYINDEERAVMTAFDDAEKAHKYASVNKAKALQALESATQAEALAYNTYKSTRCAYAFYKLSKNQAVQDNTKDLCGIIKSEPIADLSLAK